MTSVPSRRQQGRCFADDERAVSEVVGYLITFGISTVVLVASLQAFNAIRDETRDIATDRAIEEVASQVAFAVEEALRAGDLYPEAEFQMTVPIPREVVGGTYRVELNHDHLWVNSTNAAPAATNRAGDFLEVNGRTREEFVKRADVKVQCSGPATSHFDSADEATCVVHSPEGELTVRYGYLVGPGENGVYLSVR